MINIVDNTKRYKAIHELSKIFKFKLPIDGLTSIAMHSVQIDIIKLDSMLAESDTDYNSENCTYKGVVVSMSDYVLLKFGSKAHDLLESII